jgi:hypothetical protein
MICISLQNQMECNLFVILPLVSKAIHEENSVGSPSVAEIALVSPPNSLDSFPHHKNNFVSWNQSAQIGNQMSIQSQF